MLKTIAFLCLLDIYYRLILFDVCHSFRPYIYITVRENWNFCGFSTTRFYPLLSLFSQHIANYISGIQTIGHRVIVSDVQESFIWVRYKRNENQLIIFADDTYPRWVTTASLLDYDTVAGADKFGNICVVS